ncbi:hypothetical protein HELRODRAFT_173602 [Helobdella robusta]|uniref:Glycosyltransferase 61 catalytic domain-containing protein n=1 Tax=Helobdella robusta TaxID=6412 RepID=T1F708_HELRO|nr:hypothetical protein HELRODRAFT_173602 [Helobdella robusta]ESO03316.1 hypothetical protein HELRODRAFT_173602 [Helobdella robusta]
MNYTELNSTIWNETIKNLFEGDESFYDKLNNFSCVYNLPFYVINSKKFGRKLNRTSNEILISEKIYKKTCLEITSRTSPHCPNRFLLLNKYYRLTSTEEFCNWVFSGSINYDYSYYYNFTCNTDEKKASQPTSIQVKFYPQLYSMNRSIKMIPSSLNYIYQIPDVLYPMQIYTNAIINNVNQVFCKNLYVRPNDCYQGGIHRPSYSELLKLPQYDEVYLISQYWGEGFFHSMIEDIPRLSLFVTFLKKNPQIKILSMDSNRRFVKILNILGLNESRLVFGKIRTNIAYVPRSTPCGSANIIELQYLHRQFRNYILKKLVKSTYQPRDKLILIKRTGKRHFLHHEKISSYLNMTAQEYGFTYHVYTDNPLPSLNETMLIFGSASIIVAPHGAGLSNILFSQPGILIIEGLCYLPNINLCYQRTSHILGMQWHGLPSKGCGGHLDTNASLIDATLRKYLNVIPLNEVIVNK